VTGLKIYIDTLELNKENKLHWFEIIGLRYGFGIYTGWVTSATILNFSIMFYDWGFYQGHSGFFWNESYWGSLMLSVAICIYLTWGYRKRDPVYCAVFIWVCAAIIVK
jgi:hypothetical protein